MRYLVAIFVLISGLAFANPPGTYQPLLLGGVGCTNTDVGPTSMSNNSTSVPTGFIASSANADSGHEAYFAFNGVSGSSSNYWFYSSAVSGTYLQLQFPAATSICSYTMQNYCGGASNQPSAWTLQGSNDGSSFSTVETRATISWSGACETKTFTLAAISTSYSYYRFTTWTFSNSGPVISQIRFIK